MLETRAWATFHSSARSSVLPAEEVTTHMARWRPGIALVTDRVGDRGAATAFTAAPDATRRVALEVVREARVADVSTPGRPPAWVITPHSTASASRMWIRAPWSVITAHSTPTGHRVWGYDPRKPWPENPAARPHSSAGGAALLSSRSSPSAPRAGSRVLGAAWASGASRGVRTHADEHF
jgi:hypothetical protein